MNHTVTAPDRPQAAPDGEYTVRVTARGAFGFPDSVATDNDFVTTGPPAGDPERGVDAALLAIQKRGDHT